MRTSAVILGVFVILPIWFYLLYAVLKRVDASELMWFLYWIYLPVNVLVTVLTRLVEGRKG